MPRNHRLDICLVVFAILTKLGYILPVLGVYKGDSEENLTIGLENHYENTLMQHTAIFHARKNDNFHLKI